MCVRIPQLQSDCSLSREHGLDYSSSCENNNNDAVQMGRGGTTRPPEAEWSSGVAASLGLCYDQDIFKDPKDATITRRC